MESETDRVVDLTGLSESEHHHDARQLAPSDVAQLVEDQVSALVEAAYVAAAQIHTEADSVVSDAQQMLIDFQRALDEFADRLGLENRS